MWLVRVLLLFVVVALVITFTTANVQHHTSLTLLRTYDNLPLPAVLLGAMLGGAILVFVVMVFREFTLRQEMRRLRRDNLRLDDEITALRNLPLAGLDAGKDVPSRTAER